MQTRMACSGLSEYRLAYDRALRHPIQLKFANESTARDTEHRSGPLLVASRVGQDPEDGFSLETLEVADGFVGGTVREFRRTRD